MHGPPRCPPFCILFHSILFHSVLWTKMSPITGEKYKCELLQSQRSYHATGKTWRQQTYRCCLLDSPNLEGELPKNTGVIEKITWKQGTKLKTNQQENNRRKLWEHFSFVEIHIRHLKDEQWSHKDLINQDKEQQLYNIVNLWFMLAMGIYNMITKEQSKLMEWVTVAECRLLKLHLFPVDNKQMPLARPGHKE